MKRYTFDEFKKLRSLVAKSMRSEALLTERYKKLFYKMYNVMCDTHDYKGNNTLIIQRLNKYIKYFIDSNFYHWRERVEKLELSRSSSQTYEIFQMRYGSCADKFWRDYRKSIAITEENMIKKYGEKLGKEKWESYCKLQAETNTFEYKHSKYGMTEDEFKEYNKSRSQTRENMIQKHGLEEGERRWNEYCEKQKYSGCSLEYFQEKYGKEKGLEKYKDVCFRKSHTLESYIYKFGQEEGIVKFNNYYKEIASKNPIFASKTSQDFFDAIYRKLPIELQEHTYYKRKNKEYGINYNNTYYFYDFVITNIKYCIEYNGDYWHANPSQYTEADVIKYPNQKIVKVADIWERDKLKNNIIKDRKFYLDIIWESAYNLNPVQTTEEIYERIMRIYKLGIN